MAKVFVVSMLVALSAASDSYGGGYGSSHVSEQTHVGEPRYHTSSEVVGSRTVQVGTRAYQAGHTYQYAGTDVQQAPAYSYPAGEPITRTNTVPIPPPQLPHAEPRLSLPPPPINKLRLESKKIHATRKHTVITPVQTRVEPQIQKIPVPYDVPVAVPRPVERIVENVRHVPRPYPVEVTQPYPVPQPYVVNPVKHVVEQPVINKHTTSVEQPVVQEHSHSHTQSYGHTNYGGSSYGGSSYGGSSYGNSGY